MFKGNYKWMLWGDDDTMWFPYGARRLLHNWDHSLPHAITGGHSALEFLQREIKLIKAALLGYLTRLYKTFVTA
jgi:hypothetical protein